MDTKKVLEEMGVSKKEAEKLADLIESMNQNELLYMIVYIAGMKAGEEIECKRKEKEKEL